MRQMKPAVCGPSPLSIPADPDESLFETVGKNVSQMESISRPVLSFWADAWRRFRKNKVAFVSMIVIGLYVFLAIFAPILSRHSFTATACGTHLTRTSGARSEIRLEVCLWLNRKLFWM